MFILIFLIELYSYFNIMFFLLEFFGIFVICFMYIVKEKKNNLGICIKYFWVNNI